MSDRAFLGMFAHVDPRAPGQTMVATIALPRSEYGSVIASLGAPDPELGPTVAVLPCLRPDYPRSDDEAVLLAALRAANRLLEAGLPRLSPELLHELGALHALTAGRRRRDITQPPPARPEALR